jgi:hypothetical protein
MQKTKFLIFSILFFSVFSQLVFAQFDFGQFNGVQGMVRFFLGSPSTTVLPPEWLAVPNVIYFIIFPFIGIVSLIYGLLSELHLFSSQTVKLVLSISIAGVTLPTGGLIAFVYYAFNILAGWSVGVFVFVFAVGVLFWGISKSSGLHNELVTLRGEEGKIERHIRDCDQKWSTGGYGSKEQYEKERDYWVVQLGVLRNRKKVLEEQPVVAETKKEKRPSYIS